jgi:hypothetical protein
VTRIARGAARSLFWVGVAFIALGLVVAGVGLYVGTWPLRRLAIRSSAGARMAALQELLTAVAGTVAVFRTPD